MQHLKSYHTFNESLSHEKVYYHGRSSQRGSFRGKYIYLTDSIEYAAGYAEGRKEVYAFRLTFPEDQIFSIRNPEHQQLLEDELQHEAFLNIIECSTDSNGDLTEIDWATLGNIMTDEHEDEEEFLTAFGFKAVRLRERPYADSILVFDQSNVELVEMVDLTTPDKVNQLRDWETDVTSRYNHL